jgi:hypothetical protein
MARKKRRPQKKTKPTPKRGIVSTWRSLKLPLLLIVIALIPRLLVLIGSAGSPTFDFPVIDSQIYHETAQTIALGDIMGIRIFWVSYIGCSA